MGHNDNLLPMLKKINFLKFHAVYVKKKRKSGGNRIKICGQRRVTQWALLYKNMRDTSEKSYVESVSLKLSYLFVNNYKYKLNSRLTSK